jgi:hypothetical protein
VPISIDAANPREPRARVAVVWHDLHPRRGALALCQWRLGTERLPRTLQHGRLRPPNATASALVRWLVAISIAGEQRPTP